MPNHTILPDPETLRLFYVAAEANTITLTANTIASEARCPYSVRHND
jgi:hypothetical protein